MKQKVNGKGKIIQNKNFQIQIQKKNKNHLQSLDQFDVSSYQLDQLEANQNFSPVRQFNETSQQIQLKKELLYSSNKDDASSCSNNNSQLRAEQLCHLNDCLLGLSDKFNLLNKVGQGGFGFVYKAQAIDTEQTVAIKFEKVVRSHKRKLEIEFNLLKKMRRCVGFPKVYYIKQEKWFSFMVLQFLNKNLEQLFRMNNKFSIKTVCMIGIEMLKRLFELHKAGIVYRDVKPENIMIDINQPAIIYLIDFGLAKPIYDSNKQHINMVMKNGLVGTARYASLNSHNEMELSRRDDIESLAYMLIYFAKGSLPWQRVIYNDRDERNKKIFEIKKNTSILQMCDGLPSAFGKVLHHSRGLQFKEAPNYKFIIDQLYNAIRETGAEFDYVFDWCQKRIQTPQRLGSHVDQIIKNFDETKQKTIVHANLNASANIGMEVQQQQQQQQINLVKSQKLEDQTQQEEDEDFLKLKYGEGILKEINGMNIIQIRQQSEEDSPIIEEQSGENEDDIQLISQKDSPHDQDEGWKQAHANAIGQSQQQQKSQSSSNARLLEEESKKNTFKKSSLSKSIISSKSKQSKTIVSQKSNKSGSIYSRQSDKLKQYNANQIIKDLERQESYYLGMEGNNQKKLNNVAADLNYLNAEQKQQKSAIPNSMLIESQDKIPQCSNSENFELEEEMDESVSVSSQIMALRKQCEKFKFMKQILIMFPNCKQNQINKISNSHIEDIADSVHCDEPTGIQQFYQNNLPQNKLHSNLFQNKGSVFKLNSVQQHINASIQNNK